MRPTQMRCGIPVQRAGLALALAAALAPPLWAAEPATNDRPATPPVRRPSGPVALVRSAIDSVREREIVQMVAAIVQGSQLGPGDGWFKSSQSRYGWNWLARQFDDDGDDVISEDEFQGPAEMFKRLDRDRDGELTREDFGWSDRSPYVQQLRQAAQWSFRIDESSNGRISPEEWDKFYQKLSGAKGYVTSEDLRAALFPPETRPKGPPTGGPTTWTFLKGLYMGELGSFFEGPAVGDRAPDFALATQDGKRTVKLSESRGKQPVVLVFGSFT